jgi:hypothetical protein
VKRPQEITKQHGATTQKQHVFSIITRCEIQITVFLFDKYNYNYVFYIMLIVHLELYEY